jgi:hypothetical protein
LKKMPFTIPSTAWSSAASLEHDVGRLAAQLERERHAAPRERGLDVLADPVEPVNATLSMSGSRTSAPPAAPSPGMIWTTPAGSSAS